MNEVNQLPNNPIIPTEQVPEKQSNFIVILLSILLFIAVVIAGFFAWQVQQLNNELRILNVELTQKQTPTPQATYEPGLEPEEVPLEVLTKDWKTYTGKIFTFKYPKDMVLTREDIQDPDDIKNIGDLVQLSNSVYKLQVSSDFMGGWGGSVCLITKDRKIDGHESQVLYFRDAKSGTDICLDQYIDLVALIENNSFIHPYPILFELKTIKDNGVVDSKLFDQILSTFKFTK